MSENLIKKLFQYVFHEEFSSKHLNEEIKCVKKYHKSTKLYWKSRWETHRSTALNIDMTFFPRIFPWNFHLIFLGVRKKSDKAIFLSTSALCLYILFGNVKRNSIGFFTESKFEFNDYVLSIYISYDNNEWFE